MALTLTLTLIGGCVGFVFEEETSKCYLKEYFGEEKKDSKGYIAGMAAASLSSDDTARALFEVTHALHPN